MRLFIAIEIPEEIRLELYKKTEFLQDNFPQISWVPVENIHLTLKFLGNINKKLKMPACRQGRQNAKCKINEDEYIIKIKKGLENCIVGIKPFSLSFTRLGCFNREQLIIWWGIKPVSELLKLIRQLEKEMKKLGFVSEKRPYFPHVTLGRGKRLEAEDKENIRQAIKQTKFFLQAAFPVSEIMLMESILVRMGPVYKVADKLVLSGKGYII